MFNKSIFFFLEAVGIQRNPTEWQAKIMTCHSNGVVCVVLETQIGRFYRHLIMGGRGCSMTKILYALETL